MRRIPPALLLLLLLLSPGVASAHSLTVVTQGCIPLVVLDKADFDGDGKPDVLLGASTQSQGAYRSLLVKSAGGKILLDITDPGYFYFAKVAEIGAPNPILLAGTRFGNKWSKLEAWTYVPNQGFRQLWWDSSFKLVGLVEQVDTSRNQIRVVTPTGSQTYRYTDGALRSAGT